MHCNKVLLIDDDPDTVALYHIFVREMGFGDCFFTSKNGEEAFRYLERCETFPEVLLVDINMDVMDGFEFVKQYEEKYYDKHPDTIVLILSHSVYEADRAKALALRSVNAFISKPLPQTKLKELFRPGAPRFQGM